jgi:hypothetical protein
LPKVLEEADSLVVDADKFKQRAGAEFVLSVLRGTVVDHLDGQYGILISSSRVEALAYKELRAPLEVARRKARCYLRANQTRYAFSLGTSHPCAFLL